MAIPHAQNLSQSELRMRYSDALDLRHVGIDGYSALLRLQHSLVIICFCETAAIL